jgi:hypothetical protein
MKLTDFVRGVPGDLWAIFEPILPPVVWQGNGRKPYPNRACLHALLYVLAAGIANGPGRPASACVLLAVVRSKPVWARFATRWSGAITSSLS